VKSVLVISDRDNVATALEALEPGQSLDVRGSTVTVRDAIPRGHKIALAPIAAGDAVVKYGSPIGLASADIRAGAHVHIHNLSSSRGRGDLEAGDRRSDTTEPSAEGRLAEPPDDRDGSVTGQAIR
jgi:altronate dehydratase